MAGTPIRRARREAERRAREEAGQQFQGSPPQQMMLDPAALAQGRPAAAIPAVPGSAGRPAEMAPPAPPQRPQERPPEVDPIVWPVVTAQAMHQAEKLRTLADMALNEAHAILSIKTPEAGDKNYVKILSIKRDTIAAVLMAQVRVDESALKSRSGDRISQVLEAIKKEQAKGQRLNGTTVSPPSPG